MSETATKKAAPTVTRINLPIGGSHWKCRPRTTPFADLEWFVLNEVCRKSQLFKLVCAVGFCEEAAVVLKYVRQNDNNIFEMPGFNANIHVNLSLSFSKRPAKSTRLFAIAQPAPMPLAEEALYVVNSAARGTPPPID